MPTNNNPQMIVEDGMDEITMNRIKRMQADDPDLKRVEYGKPEFDEIKEEELNLDAPVKDDAGNAEDKTDNSDDGAPTANENEEYKPIDMTAFAQMAEDQGLSEDELAEKIFHNRKFKVKMNGKHREMAYSDIKSHLSRETTFQKKYDELNNSEEIKMGHLVSAAKGGDKAAQKKLQQYLKEFTGAEDVDDMNDRLDSVSDDFDEDASYATRRDSEKFDAEFADVKDDVDYADNLNIIQTEIKSRMPAKVWERYWNTPTDRKSMYALAASGKSEILLDTFQSEVDLLPLEKQLELVGDPDLYGRAFLSMINRLNAKASKQEEGIHEDDGLNAVSTGRKVGRPKTSETPDFMKMSSEEFLAFQRKHGLAP